MNENYGKLENGVLTFAPSNLIIGEVQVFNATAEEYLAAGYLPIKRTPKPNEGEWQAVYTEVDGIILQSWLYEGRVHDHENLEVLNEVSIKSLSGVPAVHILPTDAKEGDLCLYAKPNTLTLTDSGKKIYFDWEEFRKPVDESDTTEIYTEIVKNNGEVNVNIRLTRSNDSCECFIEDYVSGVLLQVWFTDGVFDFAHYGDTEYNSIEEIPAYYQLPQFDNFEYNNLEGNAYLFHTEYRLMKYQGGEWSEITSTYSEVENYIPADKIGLTTETATLEPNVYYSFGEVSTLTLEFAEGEVDKVNEYMFSFTSGATPTVLTLPSTVKWVNELTVEANKRYEISIVDNIGLWCAVEVSE